MNPEHEVWHRNLDGRHPIQLPKHQRYAEALDCLLMFYFDDCVPDEVRDRVVSKIDWLTDWQEQR